MKRITCVHADTAFRSTKLGHREGKAAQKIDAQLHWAPRNDDSRRFVPVGQGNRVPEGSGPKFVPVSNACTR